MEHYYILEGLLLDPDMMTRDQSKYLHEFVKRRFKVIVELDEDKYSEEDLIGETSY